MQYGMGFLPDKSINPSVIYANYLNRGQAADLTAELTDFIAASGFRRVLTGHQPHADAPLLICEHDVHFCGADSSYAGNVLWESNGQWIKVRGWQTHPPAS